MVHPVSSSMPSPEQGLEGQARGPIRPRSEKNNKKKDRRKKRCSFETYNEGCCVWKICRSESIGEEEKQRGQKQNRDELE